MRHLVSLVLLVVVPSSAVCASPQTSAEQTAPAPVAELRAAFTLDTPIQQLVADAGAKAVLDRELPGLTTHARYEQFKGMSLKALKPCSGGLISDERLQAVETGLKALNAPVA